MLNWKTIIENLGNYRHKTKNIHFAIINNEELIQYWIIATMEIWAFEKIDEGILVEGIENNEGNYLELANNAKYYYQLQQEMTDVIKNLKTNVDFDEIFEKCNNSFINYVKTLEK